MKETTDVAAGLPLGGLGSDALPPSPDEIFRPTPLEKWKRVKENIARLVLMGMALLLVLPMLAIFAHLFIKAWPALSWSFFTQNPQNYMTAGGIWAPLVGTFCLVLLSLLAAAPVGVLAGVYLNEYARDNWLTRIINLAVMNLAGVPSIVHALFGVGAFVLFAHMGRSMLAASCTLAVMTLPVIITSTREALAAVPMAFREACWNLGASRWQTIRTIVLPNSISGILTGVILQVSRAAGETAPILFTGAVFFAPVADHGWRSFFPYGLGDRCMALSMHLFTLVDPGPRRARVGPIRHGRGADRPGAGRQQPVDRAAGLPSLAEEVVERPCAGAHPLSTTSSVSYGKKAAPAEASPWRSRRGRYSGSSGRPTPARRRC